MSQQRFCTSCGHPVEGVSFCTNCGTPVAVSGAPSTTAPAAPPPAAPPSAPPTQPPTHTHLAPTYASSWAKPAPATAPPNPHPPRTPRKRGPGTAMWVLLAAILVLLVGGGAFALGTLALGSDEHGATPPTEVSAPAVGATEPVQPPSSAPSTTPSTAAPSSTAPSASPSTIDPASADGVARSISALMTDSQVDKSEVSRASSDLQSCQRVAAAIVTFQSAAASRQRLVKEVSAIDAGKLPGGQAVISQLSQAWGTAAQADAAYVQWGRSFHRVGVKCVDNAALQRRASTLSVQSHPYKQAAARAWNPIARKHGLPAVSWDQL